MWSHKWLGAACAVAALTFSVAPIASAETLDVGTPSANGGGCIMPAQAAMVGAAVGNQGTLTAFRRYSSNVSQTLRFVVLRPVKNQWGGDDSQIVGITAEINEIGDQALHSYPANIAVQPTDRIGVVSLQPYNDPNYKFILNNCTAYSDQGAGNWGVAYLPSLEVGSIISGVPGSFASITVNVGATIVNGAKRCATKTAAYFKALADRQLAADAYAGARSVLHGARSRYYAHRTPEGKAEVDSARDAVTVARAALVAAKSAASVAQQQRTDCLRG